MLLIQTLTEMATLLILSNNYYAHGKLHNAYTYLGGRVLVMNLQLRIDLESNPLVSIIALNTKYADINFLAPSMI